MHVLYIYIYMYVYMYVNHIWEVPVNKPISQKTLVLDHFQPEGMLG